MDLSNGKNLVQQLGLKPCPLCGNHIYIDSIRIDNDDISELKLHCRRCDTEYTLHTPIFRGLGMFKRSTFELQDVIGIWNNRGELTTKPRYDILNMDKLEKYCERCMFTIEYLTGHDEGGAVVHDLRSDNLDIFSINRIAQILDLCHIDEEKGLSYLSYIDEMKTLGIIKERIEGEK